MHNYFSFDIIAANGHYIKMYAYPEEVTGLSWVYRQIESLPTPCGKIVVMDEAGTLCKFSVRKNPYSPDYHLFYGTPQEIAFNTDTNYLLCVSVESLKIGHTYKICLLGAPLQYGDMLIPLKRLTPPLDVRWNTAPRRCWSPQRSRGGSGLATLPIPRAT